MMRRHKLSLLVLLLTAVSYLSHGQSEIYPGGDYVDGSGAGKVYAGPFVLTTADSGSTVSLESAATGSEDASITVIGGAAEATYYVRDHLGSVRTIVSSTGTVLERNDYYPFGKRHATGNSYPVLSSNLQKFNGKELQTVGSSSLRFLDYGARMYDPTTVRWLTQDPMAEKYYGYSPYNYCVGNPVLYVDEEGNGPG